MTIQHRALLEYEQKLLADPQIRKAIDELIGIIRERYPEARFDVGLGGESSGIHVRTTVDVEDTEDVTNLYMDRLVDMQVEEGLPIHVIPVRPLARTTEMLRQRREKTSSSY